MSVLDLAHEAIPVETPCRSNDPELWFADNAAGIRRAQVLCRPCPLRSACLTGALQRGEPWGVWGGELFERGEVVARKRPPGRPRKDDQALAAAAAADLDRRLRELAVDLDGDLEPDLDASSAA